MDLSSSNVFDPFLKPFITFGLRNILWQWVPLFNYAFYEKVLPSVGLNLLVWQHQQVPSNSQEKQWTVGSYLLFSMSIRTWQTFTSCSYHPFPACRLLICLFFHRYRSCCPSLLILNAFLPAFSSSAQPFWSWMARRHTTVGMRFNWAESLRQFILNVTVTSSDGL